ncbi:MAG: hypothetical protein PHY92_07240 [Alphaproteobacteria bacterium]|nr:hypothetical protein [Alphaproteobacteria bacterium]
MRPVSRRGLFFTAILSSAILFFATAPRAYANGDGYCDYDQNTTITVTPVFDEPVEDGSKSLAEINQMAQASKDIIPRYDSVTLGVTHYKPVLEFRAPIVQKPMDDGSFCARIEHIDASVGYREVTIYIASELSSDPCAGQHVMTHEQRHVAVNRKILKEYVPIIQERLSSYFRLYGRLIAPNAEFAETLVREKATAILQEMTLKMLEENRRRQRLVDTPEEYARNNVVCNGRINALVHQYNVSRR